MIASTKKLEKYCTDYTKIENYQEALKSPLKFDLHHRLEISEMQSASDLIAKNLYYYRPPEELIFLEHRDHSRLHNKGKFVSKDTRKKMSEALKGKNVVKHLSAAAIKKMSDANRGKHRSEETRAKMSAAQKGKHFSAETRKKISDAMKGRHWHLENGKRIYTD